MSILPIKSPANSTVLLVTGSRIARVDLNGAEPVSKHAARPVGNTVTEAVKAALALGGKAGPVWIFTEDVFSQQVSLNPTQLTGLSQEQVENVLSFEIEPFSGIPVPDGVVGFSHEGAGVFKVIQIPRSDYDAIQHAVAACGGKLGGIGHSSNSTSENDFLTWLPEQLQKAKEGLLPVILVTAPVKSYNLPFMAGALLELAVLLFALINITWITSQRNSLSRRNAELVAVARDLGNVTSQSAALNEQLTNLAKQEAQQNRVSSHRRALHTLLSGLAENRPQAMVLKEIRADGLSSLTVNGVSLEPNIVDELSMALTKNLHSDGWVAQVKTMSGRNKFAGGGPWDFALTIAYGVEAEGKPSIATGGR